LASAAAGQWPHVGHFLLFLAGAIVMRGAGSTWNDIVDRDLDGRVARTRGRPIPSGAVSARQAAAFMLALCLAGLAVLLTFNNFTVMLGFAALLPVVVYPFMKRVTNHPQIVLGLAFAWGGLMGWAAIFGKLEAPALLLYAAAITWTVGYDTIYALQDVEDDSLVGIGSTAIAWGPRAPALVAGMYALTVGLVGAALWYALPDGAPIAWFFLGLFAAHLLWQVRALRLGDWLLALRLFKSNRDSGLILTAGLVLESAYRAL
ncbi:MAG TPA: 4-hydroxybenzoate octaprenyltransferase, partial [Beijerinckiaceae bacterium]|nr:4-hydroxybenzoate octaprenyltransferase [Beijerinckiaceae bacterium]